MPTNQAEYVLGQLESLLRVGRRRSQRPTWISELGRVRREDLCGCGKRCEAGVDRTALPLKLDQVVCEARRHLVRGQERLEGFSPPLLAVVGRTPRSDGDAR